VIFAPSSSSLDPAYIFPGNPFKKSVNIAERRIGAPIKENSLDRRLFPVNPGCVSHLGVGFLVCTFKTKEWGGA